MLRIVLLCVFSSTGGCVTIASGGAASDAAADSGGRAASLDASGESDSSTSLDHDAASSAPDGGAGDSSADAPSDAGASPGPVWSMGYYYGREKNIYPVSAVDWPALTHVSVAFYLPMADGSLDETLGLDSVAGPALANEIVAAAHAHGVKAIASIGGAQSGPAFEAATAAGTIGTLAANLGNLLTTYGYDGLDLDWEPLPASDAAAVAAVADQVRAAHPGAILTLPVAYTNGNHPPDLSGFSTVAAAFDRINVMTYHMAGPWPGWKSWHTSALAYSDTATPSSIEDSVGQYLAAGVSPGKLGFGIAFYGLCYTEPVTGPDQPLGDAGILDVSMTYADIMASYYAPSARQWDSLARVPYLSFAAPTGPNGCSFVTYDDAQSIAEKGAYLKSKKLGGVIVWTINRGYVSSQSPLLEAVRTSFLE